MTHPDVVFDCWAFCFCSTLTKLSTAEIIRKILCLLVGHLIGPVICHTFCNFMGFPVIDQIPSSKYPRCEYFKKSFFIWLTFLVSMFSVFGKIALCPIFWYFDKKNIEFFSVSCLCCFILFFFPVISASFLAGLILFLVLALPLTNPTWYNSIYYQQQLVRWKRKAAINIELTTWLVLNWQR